MHKLVQQALSTLVVKEKMLITSQEPDFVAILIAISGELINLRKPVV